MHDDYDYQDAMKKMKNWMLSSAAGVSAKTANTTRRWTVPLGMSVLQLSEAERTLDGLIAHASRHAAVELATGATCDLTFFMVTRDGETLRVVPLHIAQDDSQRAAVAATIRALSENVDAVRVVYVTEAWMLPPGITTDGWIADHPQRREVLLVVAEDEAVDGVRMEFAIDRAADGPPSLGALLKKESLTGWKGRFVGMLPRKTEQPEPSSQTETAAA
jgi:hypothetical protein